MPNSKQTPRAEMAERFAESTGLRTATMAAGLEDHRRMMADNARRLAEGHKAMARAAGMEDLVADPGGDDVGDILVTGDINVGTNGSRPKVLDKILGQSANGGAVATKPSASLWPKIVAAALLGGGGVAGVNALTDDTPPPAVVAPAPDRWSEFNVEKWIPTKD